VFEKLVTVTVATVIIAMTGAVVAVFTFGIVCPCAANTALDCQ
jgi:hypothetical protein